VQAFRSQRLLIQFSKSRFVPNATERDFENLR